MWFGQEASKGYVSSDDDVLGDYYYVARQISGKLSGS